MRSKEIFCDRFDVSRETIERFEKYENLLLRWNKSINLVGKSTLDDIWFRHFLDSAEAFEVLKDKTGSWLDIGSGAGLPGIVLTFLCEDKHLNTEHKMIEADQRKSEFLRTVLRTTGASAQVITQRIGEATPQNANVLTARALSPLAQLLAFADLHLHPGGVCVFHKGSRWAEEIEVAKKSWSFDLTVHRGPSSENSVLLEIGDIQRV